MPLQSEFKKNGQLRACAESDPAHIGRSFNSKGEHVKLIIKALNAWLEREDLNPRPAKLSESLDTYTDEVAKRVALFKTKKNILNFRNQIDDIVGIKTVAALDKELPVELDPVDVESSFMDVIVQFEGSNIARPLSEEEVIPSSLLSLYMTKKIATKTRKLLRLGFKTNGFGADTQVIRTVLQEKIQQALGDEFSPGHVFVFGSSSGGRNAMEFSNEFAANTGAVRYLAVADAAFFPQDTQEVPDLVPTPTNIPIFKVAFSAQERKNFFQIAGNRSSKIALTNRKIFVSEMANKEIHGAILGFRPFNQTGFVANRAAGLTGTDRDDTLHIELIKLAVPLIRSDISLVLNGLP